MQRIQIKTVTHNLFPEFWKIYESSFPLSEKRTKEDQICIFSHSDYFLEIWVLNEKILGFISWWDCDDLRFVEHYAIHPEYRSLGYGSSFLSEWITENDIPVLLEIEPVTDEITQGRKDFYLRLGFKENNIQHFQPAYHKETGPVEMNLLSYHQPISKEIYRKFYHKQCYEIMPCL